MIECAVKAQAPFAWMVGDEVHGGNPKLRSWLVEQATRTWPLTQSVGSDMIPVAAGPRCAGELTALVPGGWQRLSCADESKGNAAA